MVGQSPSGGAEAKKGTEVRIAVGEAGGVTPGYNLIQDPTQNLSVEVPPSWGVETGEDSEIDAATNTWSYYAGEYLTSSITTAPNLKAWYSAQPPATGAYIVASRRLAQSYTDEELIFDYGPSAGLAANCTAGPYEDFERSSYTGKKQTWYCPSGRTFYVMAAAPEGRECVVTLQLAVPTQGASEAERKAIQHILDTFEVNCEGIAGAKTGHRDTAGFARVDGHISPGQLQL